MQPAIFTINKDIQSGQPVFTGTRVPVKSLFDYISTGETLEDYLEDYPSVKRSQALALLEMTGKLFISTSQSILNEDFAG